MPDSNKNLLGELLVEHNFINTDQLEEALRIQRETDEKLGQILINLGYVDEKFIIDMLEFQLGIPYISLEHMTIEPEIMKMVPENLLRKHKIVPVKKEDNKLFLAMVDPFDLDAIDDVSLVTGLQIEPLLSSPREIDNTFNRCFSIAGVVEESFHEFENNNNQELDLVLDLENAGQSEEDAPIIKAVNTIFKEAIDEGVSDIHIEPYEKKVRVRYRIDGVLRDVMNLPKSVHSALTSRIKLLAGMDISEKKIPQDGRIQISSGNINVDFRVSSLPLILGEKIVIRILDKSKVLLRVEDLSFQELLLKQFKRMIHQPHGMILITGPTGSGKTTTLYAAISNLNDEERNIITIENPVEYVIEDINQLQVNPKAGLSFASGLRSILRQDPDIIMVGEIRDMETADIAVRAATTGHLVFATLHTNNAAGALTRLIDMGVQPFQVASSVTCVIAQRLVRRICKNCTETYELPGNSQERIFIGDQAEDTVFLKRGRGCDRCRNTGYKGRLAIHELMLITPEIRSLIMQKAPTSLIYEKAVEQGMTPLTQDGIIKVLKGLTTVSEVMRVCSSDEA